MKRDKNRSALRPALSPKVVSDYAYHLYEQSGRTPGRALDNWLEAEACIRANLGKEDVPTQTCGQRENRQELQSLAEHRI